MDTVHRFLFEDLDIRGALVRLGPAWRQMQGGRGYAPAVRDLLGHLTAVGTLIAGNLKVPGHLRFQCRGEGPVTLLVVDCDSGLRLRGVARTEGAVAETDNVAQLLGTGQIELSLQTGEHGQRYESIVPLEGDTTAAVFEHYLTQSEQSPARLWLHADAAHACGLFLQKLPTADERDADGWNRVQQLAATVTGPELALTAETLLTRLFAEETLRLFDPRDVSYHCPRDEQKVLAMLRLLGREEVEAALADKGMISITDDICNQEYRYGREVLDLLFPPASPGGVSPAPTLH